MRAEVSFLFRLEDYYKAVKEAHIGGGVYLQVLSFSESQRNWLKELLASDPRLKARKVLDEGYNCRFHIALDEVTNVEDPRIEQAQQLILRAIVLSRIIHPTPIATGGPWIKSVYPDTDPPYHRCESGVGPYIRAYTAPAHSKLTITPNDAARMAELWANFQHLFDNEEKYRRIIRALKYFDAGYHLWNSEFRHMVFCAALESLICTQRDSIKAQFVQRLPRLIPEITERQARTIYYLLDDFKHRASPWLIKTTDINEMVADNQERSDAVLLAEKSLRSLLLRAVSDQTFADLLADGGEFARKYPVEIRKSSIGDLIIRDQGVRGGRSTIAGTGITVHRIADWYNKEGVRPEEIADRIGNLSLAQVYAALAHYHANRDEIDAEIVADEAEGDRLEQEHNLSLQSRS